MSEGIKGISSAEFIRRSIEPGIQGKIDNSIKSAQREGQEFDPNNKQDRFDAYLDRMEQIFTDDDPEKRQRKIEIFKERFVYPNVLIDKDNIPNSYFALQLKVDRERGKGFRLDGIKEVKDYDQETRIKKGRTIYNDQKKSLDEWFDYLSSSDATYDTWFKYYTLKSIIGLGNYDKEKKQFSKRTKDTTGIFPDLNREALSFVYDIIKKHHLKGVKEGDDDFKRIVESANFGKIYAYAIDNVTPASKENKKNTKGEWIKYDKGSGSIPFYESLKGRGTGWCIVGQEVSKSVLEEDDFYVYYSEDEQKKNVIPRIAIRMENGQVAEVRGVDLKQNMEANMVDIAQEKYHQLPGGEKFDKKDHDMKLVTLIEKKVNNNQELSKDELRFLYEVDGQIEGFGYCRDPRVGEIIDRRLANVFNDLDLIFGEINENDTSDLSNSIRESILENILNSVTLTRLSSDEINVFFNSLEEQSKKLDYTKYLLNNEYNFHGDMGDIVSHRVGSILKSIFNEKNDVLAFLEKNFVDVKMSRDSMFASADYQIFDEEQVLKDAKKIVTKIVSVF